VPTPYPAECHARAVALVRADKPRPTTAAEFGISRSCLHNWIWPDRVNRRELPGVATPESVEL
jgi:transposase